MGGGTNLADIIEECDEQQTNQLKLKMDEFLGKNSAPAKAQVVPRRLINSELRISSKAKMDLSESSTQITSQGELFRVKRHVSGASDLAERVDEVDIE